MKRFFALILAIIVSISGFALSEEVSSNSVFLSNEGEINLEELSDEELILLQSKIGEEIVKRNIPKSAIVPQGKYIIGEDIPEGTYTITTDANRNWVYFRVYSDEDYTNEIFSTTPSVNNPIGKIVLKKGMYIEIVRATMTFTVYTGIVFE